MNKFSEQYALIKRDLEKINVRLFDCRKAEPYFLNLLHFINAHPNQRDFFVSEFVNGLRSGAQPWEVIQFCMRELQWEEIKNVAIDESSKTNDWRIISVMSNIIAVYEPEWEDADLYDYYSRSSEK